MFGAPSPVLGVVAMSVLRGTDTDEGPLRIGVRVPPCDRADRVARTVRRAEELGFDQVRFPDSQLLWRDVFTTLTAAAFATEWIGLGTAVTNLATRHPSVVASAARGVAERAPGRFTLGLGVGNSSVAPVGLRQTGSAELSMLRALLDGREGDFEGKVRSRLRDPSRPCRCIWRPAGRAICGSRARSPTVSSCSAVSRRAPRPPPPPGCGRAPRRPAGARRRSR